MGVEFAEDWICAIDEAALAATSCGPRRTAVGLRSAMYILSHGSGDIGCCACRRADVAPAGAWEIIPFHDLPTAGHDDARDAGFREHKQLR